MTSLWFIPVGVLVFGAAIVWLHDRIKGENLLLDRLDAWRIRRSDLAMLDSKAAAATNRSDIIVSLSTIPSRLPHVGTTLKSLLSQKRLPREIRLNIPDFSRRENCRYDIPQWLSSLAMVRIVRCEDNGPATKFLPTLQSEGPDQKIVVVDDDRLYPPTLVADLETASNADPEAVPCVAGWIVPADLIDRPTNFSYFNRGPAAPIFGVSLSRRRPVDVVKGVGGYLVKPRFFDVKALADYSAAPPEAFFVDDVWISAHCRAPKFVVPARRMDFHPREMRSFYGATSLGRLDEDKRRNTIVLQYFGPESWAVGVKR